MTAQFDESKIKRHPKGSGDEGGQFASKGGTDFEDDDQSGAYLDEELSTKEKKALALSIAEAMGFPEKSVKFLEKAPPGERGLRGMAFHGDRFGRGFKAGYKDGDILLVLGNLNTREMLVGVTAHEIAHHWFRRSMDSPDRNPVVNDLLNRSRTHERLRREDGVTKYSRDFWVLHQHGVATYLQAANETYAEIMSLQASGGDLSGVSAAWTRVFNGISSQHSLLRKKPKGKT